MTPDEAASLSYLREGLNYLPGSTESKAALVLNLYSRSLGRMYLDGLLPAEEAVEEMRKLYAAVEAAHPGKWEALGGPRLPDTLTA